MGLDVEFSFNWVRMIRFFDIVLSLIGLFILGPILILVYVISLFDTGAPMFFQYRVGKNEKKFRLIKFRTMKLGTQSLPSYMVAKDNVTPLGKVMRKFKIDELPQLWNVLKGDMSLVGPRPVIDKEVNVIINRKQNGILDVLPGITGLAQIKKVGTEMPDLQLELDLKMLKNLTLKRYFYFVLKTVLGKGQGDCIK